MLKPNVLFKLSWYMSKAKNLINFKLKIVFTKFTCLRANYPQYHQKIITGFVQATDFVRLLPVFFKRYVFHNNFKLNEQSHYEEALVQAIMKNIFFM